MRYHLAGSILSRKRSAKVVEYYFVLFYLILFSLEENPKSRLSGERLGQYAQFATFSEREREHSHSHSHIPPFEVR